MTRANQGSSDALPLLTRRDAAALAGVCERTVLNAANAGALRCTRTTGGIRLFSKVDVLEWVARRAEGRAA